MCSWFDVQEDLSRGAAVGSEAPGRERVPCCVVGTSNRTEDVDACLRRGGRLELELEVVGRRQDRVSILAAVLLTAFGGGPVTVEEGVSQQVADNVAHLMADKTGTEHKRMQTSTSIHIVISCIGFFFLNFLCYDYDYHYDCLYFYFYLLLFSDVIILFVYHQLYFNLFILRLIFCYF